MSCITQLLEMKGDKECLPVRKEVVIEGGGVYKGYEYLITFTRHGTRCGYVALPDSHRGDMDNLNCHGGITFSGTDHGAKDLLPVACNDLWVGFDAAHYLDMRCFATAKKYFGEDAQIDLMEEIHKEIHEMESLDPNCSHKTYAYMENQCHYIIDQLLGSQAA